MKIYFVNVNYLAGDALTFALEGDGGDESLDAGSDRLVLLAILGDGASDNVLGDRVGLVERKELADVGGSLGSQSAGHLKIEK